MGLSKEYLSLFLNNRGLGQYHMRMFREAIRDYDEAIECVGGTNPEIFFNRGNVYLNQNEFIKAHNDFEQAIKLDRNCAKFHHAKGLAFQAEAEDLAKKEIREMFVEEMLVSKAIECFGDALICDNGFVSSKFH